MTTALWLALAVLAAPVSMGMFARTQQRMLRAGGTQVPMRQMVELVYAANAVNWTMPGGTALSAGYVARQLRRWGATAAGAGFTVAASGVLSAASFAALAVTGSSVGGPGVVGTLFSLGVVLVIVTVCVLVFRRPGATASAAGRVAALVRLVRRDPERAREAARRFVIDLRAIRPRPRDWLVGLGFAAGNWVADLICLYACCRALGVGAPDLSLVLVTYVVGMSASSISLLPAGLGVIDIAMIGTLTGAGLPAGTALTTIVAYRVISCGFVVVIGWACWFALRRPDQSARSGQLPRVRSRSGTGRFRLPPGSPRGDVRPATRNNGPTRMSNTHGMKR